MHKGAPKEPGFQSVGTLIKIALYVLIELWTINKTLTRFSSAIQSTENWRKKTTKMLMHIRAMFSVHSVIFNEWQTLSCP